MSVMINIRDLRFEYHNGDFSLRVPFLEILDGESVAIIGVSGSGKTTLLNLIAGILRPSEGEMTVAGSDLGLLDDPALREFRISKMGLVFQEFELLEYLDVLDNILLPFRINKALSLTKNIKERAAQLARQVGIDDKLHRYPEQLSQGERQRAATCRALLVEPTLVLADEPTGNLDSGNKDRVLDILFGYAREQNATLITVTHDNELISRFDRVIDFKSFIDDSSPGISNELGS
jgi:putative ABC transport system ATP-binding protein